MKLFQLSQLTKLSLLTLSLVVSSSVLTACDKPQVVSTESQSTQAEAPKAEVSEAVAKASATEIAKTTLETVSIVTYRYRSVKGVTDEQKTCLDNIDMKGTVPELAKLFSENFTEEELQKTVELYNKPEVKQVTEYALQMAQKMAGVEVKTLAPTPTEEIIKVVQEFGQSAIGQKLNNFTVADELIQNAVNVKIKACGIEPM